LARDRASLLMFPVCPGFDGAAGQSSAAGGRLSAKR
jgi:hypothetical protein